MKDLARNSLDGSQVVLSIVMPVYNEVHTLRRAIDNVLAVPFSISYELLVIENGSDDGSAELLRDLAGRDNRINVHFLPDNVGKSAAVQYGMNHARGAIAIVQDSDLEYDARDIPRVIQPILDDEADAVFGNRFAMRERRRALYFWNALGNQVLTLVANFLADLNLNDIETSCKAIRLSLFRCLRLRASRFGIEPELVIRLAQCKARIYEVPISYHGRSYDEGKKGGWLDGFHALWILFSCACLDRKFTIDTGVYSQSLVSRGWSGWLYEQFAAYLGTRILDAGSGIGNLTRYLIHKRQVVAVDKDPLCLDIIHAQLGFLEGFRAVEMNLSEPAHYDVLRTKFDTVVCLNVLQHMENIMLPLKSFYAALVPGGKLILLVPRKQVWYGENGNTSLIGIIEKAGFRILQDRHFNRLGGIECMFRCSERQNRERCNHHFKRLWVAKLVEKMLFLPGASRLVVAWRPEDSNEDDHSKAKICDDVSAITAAIY